MAYYIGIFFVSLLYLTTIYQLRKLHVIE